MSHSETIPLTCPKCGKKHPFTVWTSINTVIDPDMKEKVRDLSAFEFICPDCEFKQKIPYDFLYHEMENDFKIFCSVSDENYIETLELLNKADPFEQLDDNDPLKKLFNELGKNMYTKRNTRIVRNLNEFLEKLYIHDNGLDDRIIEFLKLLILFKFMKDSPENYETIDIYYGTSDEEQLIFEIWADGIIKNHVTFPKETYDDFTSLYYDYLTNKDNESFEINRDWAIQIQEKIDNI